MFREIREIKSEEKNLKLKKEEGYMKIKPEKELTEKELNDAVKFWFEEFAREAAKNEA